MQRVARRGALVRRACWSARSAAAAAEAPRRQARAKPAKAGADWQHWHANNDVTDMPSVQRGARNFTSYCLGCHSLKYERWSRLAQDLAIPADAAAEGPDPARGQAHATTSSPACRRRMREAWFGKTPPDLSLMARSRGRDYLYQFLKTFYVDPTPPDRRQQPAPADHGHAARALGARGTQARGVQGRDAARRRRQARCTSRCSITSSRSRPGASRAARVRWLRARYGELPRLRQRADAGGAARRSASGWCCSCWCSPGSRGS